MHVNFLDPYQDGRSLIHQIDARIKLPLTLALILVTSLVPVGVWPVYILLVTLTFAAEVLSELGIRFYLKRALLAVPFMLAALPVLFTVSGTPLLTLPLLGWVITVPGLERLISLALKSWISVQAAILLASTTTFPDILGAMRAMRLPRLLVAIISLMWRYLFVMVDETLRLMRARDSRSAASDLPGHKAGGSLLWRAKTTGGMAGSLFLRSLERSDRIYMGMLARGYDGEIRTLARPPIPNGQWLTLGLGLLILFALLAFSFLG